MNNTHWIFKAYLILSYAVNIYFLLITLAYIVQFIFNYSFQLSSVIIFLAFYLATHAIFSFYFNLNTQNIVFKGKRHLDKKDLLDDFEDEPKNLTFKNWKITGNLNLAFAFILCIAPFFFLSFYQDDFPTGVKYLGITIFCLGYGLMQFSYVYTIMQLLAKESKLKQEQ